MIHEIADQPFEKYRAIIVGVLLSSESAQRLDEDLNEPVPTKHSWRSCCQLHCPEETKANSKDPSGKWQGRRN